MRRRCGPLGLVVVGLIRAYQAVPKGATPRCRFEPSCSRYTVAAVLTHGTLRGIWLGTRRLLRCHPWSPGGVDPVPEARDPSREEVA